MNRQQTRRVSMVSAAITLVMVSGCASAPVKFPTYRKVIIDCPYDMVGCEPEERWEPVSEIPKEYKPCRVQWDEEKAAWWNYDNYANMKCMTIYIPKSQNCFKRVDGTKWSECQ